MSAFTVACFYKFVDLSSLEALQLALQQFCKARTIRGTIILATEGINGTVAGKADDLKALITYLRSQPELNDLECKYSLSDIMPFHKSKIVIKKEIVTLGLADSNIKPAQKTGIQVAAEAWNDIISDPNVIVIDTRNTYEVELGTFKNAIDPQTEQFRDFPDYVQKHLDPKTHKKIAMCCTGGIRCEKASAYLLEQGFETVYQLEGGILKYLEKVPEENSLWQGQCFIFDDRKVLEKETITTL